MTEHLRFEEITELVFTGTVNARYFQLASRANAHLQVCPECKKVYDILISARNQAEEVYFSKASKDARS